MRSSQDWTSQVKSVGWLVSKVVEEPRLLIANELNFLQPGVDDFDLASAVQLAADGMRSQSM